MHVIRTLRQTHTDVKLVLKHNVIVDLPHSGVSVTNANTINYKHIHSNTEREGERDNTKKGTIKSHIFIVKLTMAQRVRIRVNTAKKKD